MAKHLTDKEKKKIAAHWVECQNYSETARKFKVSDYTVKKIIKDDSETLKKLEQKKREYSRYDNLHGNKKNKRYLIL